MSFPYDFPATFPNTMALEAKISWTQSVDGKKLYLRDDTNYTEENVSPSDYTRTVELYSGKYATGTLIDTLTFSGSNLTVEYDLAADLYISAKLTVTDGDTSLTDIINFGTNAYEYNLLTQNLLKNNCGCNKDTDQSNRFGFIYLTLANYSVITGNSGAFNKFINESRTWLQN